MLESSKLVLFGAIGIGFASLAYVFYGPSPNKPKNRKNRATVSGLLNTGNQCFMNAVLQSLASCKTFINWLEKFPSSKNSDMDVNRSVKRTFRYPFYSKALNDERSKSKLDLARNLRVLLKSLNESGRAEDNGNFNAIKVLTGIINKHWATPNSEQDAHELFNLITANLETELYATLPINSLRDALLTNDLLESPVSPQANTSPPIKRRGCLQVNETNQPKSLPCRGLFASQLQCKLCSHKYPVHLDTFYSVPLVIPNTTLLGGPIMLNDCLNKLISNEIVHEVTCEECSQSGQKTSFVKRLTFAKCPQLLCFHLQRLVWLCNGTPLKRTEHVHFPEFLTMDDYVYTVSKNKLRETKTTMTTPIGLIGGTSSLINSGDVIHMNASTNQNDLEQQLLQQATETKIRYRYRLCSLIVHIGDALTGHFVAYRRGGFDTNQWYYISDLNVKRVSLKEVLAASAYMLFYERCR